ncbi:Pectin lyase-like superfamily protein [Zea mays]|uniref:Pectin lyase-like superfamily protein n=1 Tax=Zea mays TaxID=4577 RepID=A0A1D6LRI5_MAIZE|nr:Pectin lyase-like superfamily protein [Zea mays]
MVRRKSQRASMRKRPGPVGPSKSPSWAPPATVRQTAQRLCRRHGHRHVAAPGSRQSSSSRTSPTPPPPRRPLACSALPRSHAPASPWTTSTSSIAAPTTRPWLYARTPRAAPRVASRILHASRPFVD